MPRIRRRFLRDRAEIAAPSHTQCRGNDANQTATGRLKNQPHGKLAACRYDLGIRQKCFLFLRTSGFAACGRRRIIEGRRKKEEGRRKKEEG
jgi:hypothetical protein